MPRDEADELEREAIADDCLADERRGDSPDYADYLYKRAHWKRYLASNRRNQLETTDDTD